MDYWPDMNMPQRDVEISFRGRLALKLIEHFGLVAGMDGGEDTAGRAHISVMPVADVVARAFGMADLATDQLEMRGWIRLPQGTPEEMAERAGHLESIRSKAMFADRATR